MRQGLAARQTRGVTGFTGLFACGDQFVQAGLAKQRAYLFNQLHRQLAVPVGEACMTGIAEQPVACGATHLVGPVFGQEQAFFLALFQVAAHAHGSQLQALGQLLRRAGPPGLEQ